MLTDEAFWSRVKNLEDETIYTLTYASPNEITAVDNTCVHIAGQASTVPFNGKCGLYNNYHTLHRDKYLFIGRENGKLGNGSGRYVMMALILKAVPGEAVGSAHYIKLK